VSQQDSTICEIPWFKLYVGDALKGTMDMSTEEVGAFFLLLCFYWEHGELPDTDKACAQVTRLSVKSWRASAKKILARVSAARASGPSGAGLDAQREWAQKKSRKLAENGRRGAHERWQLKVVDGGKLP
jgi:uncharacterized protein YdaU (DUF1376 family)